MTPERQKILNALQELGGMGSPKQIGEIIGKDNKSVGNLLLEMSNYGFVKKSKEKHGVWILPSEDFLSSEESSDDEIIVEEVL